MISISKKNALLSVYNKTGIVQFARALKKLGWNIYSSGGTAKTLRDAKIPVIDVSTLSGLPPILGHRVVTLVPQVHGGLLSTEEQIEELKKLEYPWLDLVCVDLYPLKNEIVRQDATTESVIEKTDIGGPTMIRSGAKGRRIVVVEHADRKKVIEWLKKGEPDGKNFRTDLAAKAEKIVSEYCLYSARFHSEGTINGIIGKQFALCTYGENAWQSPAGLFTSDTTDPLSLQNFSLVEGSTPSYNNYCDMDRMLQTMTHIAGVLDINHKKIPCIAIGVKHGNSCGVSVADKPQDALQGMISGDPLALFGGIIMANFPIRGAEAKILRDWNMPDGKKRILDGVFAPSFNSYAKKELNRKEGKCRLLENKALAKLDASSLDSAIRFRYVRGGFLKQPNYTYILDLKDPELEIVGTKISSAKETELLIAWAIGSTSNSNTITLVKNKTLIGNGVGQQDRVGAVNLVVSRARRSGHDIRGAVAYSDSFFPFPDGVQVLIDAGVKAIITTKGSVNDEAVREVCRKAKISLYFLPDKKSRGFFGH
ncbi:MAG: hypothetical protein AAB508_00200 [Patescibacteria group bacterium]